MYYYDTNENLIKDSFKTKKKQGLANILHDKKGNIIEIDFYKSNGNAVEREIIEVYKVDENGYRTEHDTYCGNKDTLHYKEYIKNNTNGLEIEVIKVNNRGIIISTVNKAYDEKGNQTDYKLFKRDTLKTEIRHKYDDKGNNTEWCTFNNGKLEVKWTNTYDKNGTLVESTGFKADSSSSHNFTIHFENFDKEGNWLKWVEMKDGKPIEIKERTIEYYP